MQLTCHAILFSFLFVLLNSLNNSTSVSIHVLSEMQERVVFEENKDTELWELEIIKKSDYFFLYFIFKGKTVEKVKEICLVIE